MPHWQRSDRRLTACAVAWATCFLLVPSWHASVWAFAITSGLVIVNALHALTVLTRQRRVLVGLNCAQIVLFGMISYQLHTAFGPGHYDFDDDPGLFDWIEFTAAHVLRAADLLDALDEYGIRLQNISHASTTAGLLIVCMHLTVDAFLIGLLLRCASRYWQQAARETRLARERREFGWLLASLALYAGFVIGQRLRPSDWLLWPLDNLLRLIDVGDLFQVFGWKLHGVEENAFTSGAALLFRAAAGIWMARLVVWIRLWVLRTWGLSVEELTELLDDPDADVRFGAAVGLGRSGALAANAVPALTALLHDVNPEVRSEAAKALGRIGSAAQEAVPALADAAWLGSTALRLAAVKALGRIGPQASSAVESLLPLLKVTDKKMRRQVTEALRQIAPALLDRVAQANAPAAPPSKRMLAWKRCVDAAQRQRAEACVLRAQILSLVQNGFFAEERDAEVLSAVLAVHSSQLFIPLLILSREGALARRRSEEGVWVYRHVPA